jgi:chemotaxis protein MotB
MGAGITPDRVSIAGYGEYRPVASNGTEDGRKQNRRVDLVVTPLHTPAGAAGAADAGDGDLAADGDDAGATTPGDGE